MRHVDTVDSTTASSAEMVVLLDESGLPIGEAAKSEIHTTTTPLHLAFSCYLFNAAGELLVTRRALSKKTWPGVWTNSFCGHPAPGESMHEAIARRAQQELGAEVRDISVWDENFRYRATDASGVVENEVCPVHRATLADTLSPNPAEVMDWAWVSPQALIAAAEHAPFAFSPWLVMQLPTLRTNTHAPTPETAPHP